MKIKSIMILAVISSLAFCSCIHEPLSVTADQLYSEYFDHELNADVQFKGKTLLVNGKIADFGRNNINIAYIMLWARYENKELEEAESEALKKWEQAIDEWKPGDDKTLLSPPALLLLASGGIECWFPLKHEKDLANIKPNDNIVIRGTCKGLARNILGNPGNIILEDCSILKP